MRLFDTRPTSLAFWFFSALSAFSAFASSLAQTSFPMVTHTTPVAVERGKTTEITVDGQQNFFGAYQAVFEGTGITADVASPAVPKRDQKPLVRQVKMKVTVAADAPPGMREFRVVSTLGVSSIGQLLIVDDPVVSEGAANNTPAQAMSITLPCVIAGKLEVLEDVDYVKFEAKAGETLTFEMFCARLQDKIHDLQKHAKPMLTLFDGDGRELAANDCFFFADPMLSYTIQKTGTYYLQVRESTYDGDPRWVYAILATTRPYVSHVFPMAGNAGREIEVEPIGSARLKKPKVKLKAPDSPGIQQVRLDLDGVQTNPATFIVSPLPQILEHEPNESPGQATRFTLPAGLNGRIDKKRDLDHYVFKASKGKAVQLEMKARRFGTLLNSSVHGVLEVMNSKGAILAVSDDSHGKEPLLVFTPPDDGDYLVRVRDLNSKGGDSFVYFIEADYARPDFTLKCDPDKAMIGPGSSAAWYVQVSRTNGFAGPVQIEVHGMPKEVSASSLTIPPTMTQGVIVLTASPNATHAAANVEVIGTAKIKMPDGREHTVSRKVTPTQEIYFPGGGRGLFDVKMHTVAVTDPSDILKVEVSTTNISLKPGQEVKIDVIVHRRPDYDKGVSLDVQLSHLGRVFGNPLPPGVTVVQGKSKTLLGTGSKGHIVLKADAKAAPIDNVPICVLCHVSINFVVKVSYATPPILISLRTD